VQLLVQVRTGHTLVLKLRIPESTPPRMVPDLQSVLESVRDQPR
jgi:hypothetical protein